MRKAFPWSHRSYEPDRITLTGSKVILREKRLDDIPKDYAWRGDAELARLDASRPLEMSFGDFKKYSAEELKFGSTRSKRFAIDTLEGTHIGNCMYYDIDTKNREAEMGIMIGDREFWGKSYGTDTVSTFLKHIFKSTNLTRIYLHTLEWNHRARCSFIKSGFKEMKSVRRSGLTFIRMEILKSSWEQIQNVDSTSPSHSH